MASLSVFVLAAEVDDHCSVRVRIEALAAVDERKARVVEMRFFGGLSVDQTANALRVPVETVMRDWKLAKAWLLRELKKPSAHTPP